jgi:hypothetical protein
MALGGYGSTLGLKIRRADGGSPIMGPRSPSHKGTFEITPGRGRTSSTAVPSCGTPRPAIAFTVRRCSSEGQNATPWVTGCRRRRKMTRSERAVAAPAQRAPDRGRTANRSTAPAFRLEACRGNSLAGTSAPFRRSGVLLHEIRLAVSPLTALLNKVCAIVAVAFALPTASSDSKCLRRVLASHPAARQLGCAALQTPTALRVGCVAPGIGVNRTPWVTARASRHTSPPWRCSWCPRFPAPPPDR